MSALETRDLTTLPVLEGEHTLGEVTDRIAGKPFAKFGWGWLAGLLVSLAVTAVGVASASWLMYKGVGVWGVNQPTAWGIAIVNFVWWIGIGHAGTLISAILLLLKQSWRNSINRFAEAMTLFAVAMAGLFPLMHLGRFWKFYYLFPYPNQMRVWPQWRSPLVWDAAAVLTYFTVSLIFWYLGLLPDVATMRDTARRGWAQRVFGVMALGWRGASGHWQHLRAAYLLLAGLATPLVLSVHSIVSLDFAVSIVPGWNPTIFPPYFVAGAIYSGFAMVLTLALPLRALFRMKDIVTSRHLDLMAKVMLASGLVVAYGYITEIFSEWHSGEIFELARLHNRLAGRGSSVFWTLIACNVVIGQLLWLRSIRMRPVRLFIVSLLINLGMWLERYDIVVSSLERDYLPSSWHNYSATVFDWTFFVGTLGCFTALFLLFVRLLPVSPIYEIKEMLLHRRAHDRAGREFPVERSPSVTAGASLAAEFASPDALLHAATRATELGYTQIEAYTPLPVDGLPEALGRRASRVPLFVLLGALVGGACAFGFMSWSAVIDYPWHVGGKPLFSWPSFIPITFELTVLGGATGAVLGFLLMARLPRLHHPVFDTPGFERATRDGFFLVVSSADPKFDVEKTRGRLESWGPVRIVAAAGGAI